MAGVPAIGGPRIPGAEAAAAVAAPKLLGLDKSQEAQAAFKDGEFRSEAIQEIIIEGIEAFKWASQQIGDSTPRKAKNTEVPKGFQTSEAKIREYTSRLEGLLKELKPLSRKNNLSPTIKILNDQVAVLKALAESHKLMAKGNYTVSQALKSYAGKIVKPTLNIMEKANSLEDRQRGLAIVNLLKDSGIKPLVDAVASVQKRLNALDEFAKSPIIQALTPAAVAGRARTQMGNPALAA